MERTGVPTQNVVGPKGWKASKRDTNLTRNDLDRCTPRRQLSKSAEPRRPCFLVPWRIAQTMDQNSLTGTGKLSKVMGECTMQVHVTQLSRVSVSNLPRSLQIGPCQEQMPKFCSLWGEITVRSATWHDRWACERKWPGQRNLGSYQNSCFWRRKLVLLHICKFPVRDIIVYTRMCVHMCAQNCLTVRLWIWSVGTDLAKWWKSDSINMKAIGKGTYSGHEKHWSHGTNACYLTEQAISKWEKSDAPRTPGRKERQE